MKRWQDIPGWFNFEGVYDLAPVFLRNNKLKFLEIGSFLGKSTMYMYEILKSKNIDMDFNIIDTFTGPVTGKWKNQKLWDGFDIKPVEDFYPLFKENLGEAINEINVYRIPSIEAVNTFPDNYFDFVFIDGDHQFESVYSDISLYYPKVRTGGFFGGDDWPGVQYQEIERDSIKLAYDKYFADSEKLKEPFRHGSSWFIIKPENKD